jgi:hypothetical protein
MFCVLVHLKCEVDQGGGDGETAYGRAKAGNVGKCYDVCSKSLRTRYFRSLDENGIDASGL